MKWVIDNEHSGMIIREYLQAIHGFSRRLVKTVKLGGGEILVDGVPQTVRYTLTSGEKLTLCFPPEIRGNHMKPEQMELAILFEDEAIMIIDKAPYMATIPSITHPSGTVANGILGHYDQHKLPYTVHVVTRLDRNTSGLLLIAKHSYSHSILAASQKSGNVNRKYQAVMEGHLTDKQGTINAPIGRKKGSIIERTVSEAGKTAVTHYRVLREENTHSLVDIELETGRTHQIRVHFQHMGHPLAGDDLYGGSTALIERQALHCCFLSFEHPISKKVIQFESALPADMRTLLDYSK
ncbi:RluA family pseudouridine synthase [Virgibacillus sp. C22-A2]|uniref:Pseudouridine synthase n=1 Tax=Virgibacillus tibetensis TaxID=3042313 RepID=A0ABU6KGL3_9BACI|nr:RluA family pseudouridine synthase [Virgibacillus sp. C22-A2]